jgi:predicted ATPase
MIESIEFANCKALRATILPLAPFTLLLGPNGSGKTTALHALQGVAIIAAQMAGLRPHIDTQAVMSWSSLLSITAADRAASVQITIRFKCPSLVVTAQWYPEGQATLQINQLDGTVIPPPSALPVLRWLGRIQVYALDATNIAEPVPVSAVAMQPTGAGLAAVLDDLKDNQPERWSALLAELCEWLPEYDHILFDKPSVGQKGIALRTKRGGHRIAAKDLSQGTLVALALLALSHVPEPPSLVALEEIDRGLHPRLLRHLQDALYRLSYPQSCGETRPPIQVIATTHSPYLLDLYRDYPEEVILAQKVGLEVQFKRLSDIEHFQDILGDAPLSEVWYSGVLGGVSVKP